MQGAGVGSMTNAGPAPAISGSGSAGSARAASTPKKIVGAAIVAILLAVTVAGLPYYTLPVAQRLRHPLHSVLKSTGTLGQTAGIVAFALFLFLWLYPIRKKFRWLSFTGSVGRWLDVHIAAGLIIPWLAAIHAGWRFEGLIGLGYAAMILVCLSGIVGKYLYTRIPRSRSGLELTLSEIENRNRSLVTRIAATTGLPPEQVDATLAEVSPDPRRPKLSLILLHFLFNDIARWRAGWLLRRRWRARVPTDRKLSREDLREVVRLARRRIALTQQVRMLDATQQVFRWWHVAHRPVAITALLAVLIHVGVAVALGVTWFSRL
jgi:hypothetical protein